MMDAVSEKLVLGTAGGGAGTGAPPTAPSSDNPDGSLATDGELRTPQLGDDGVPTTKHTHKPITAQQDDS